MVSRTSKCQVSGKAPGRHSAESAAVDDGFHCGGCGILQENAGGRCAMRGQQCAQQSEKGSCADRVSHGRQVHSTRS